MSPKISHRRSTWRTCGTTKRAARRRFQGMAAGGYLIPPMFASIAALAKNVVATDIKLRFRSIDVPYREITIPQEFRGIFNFETPIEPGLIERFLEEIEAARRPT